MHHIYKIIYWSLKLSHLQSLFCHTRNNAVLTIYTNATTIQSLYVALILWMGVTLVMKHVMNTYQCKGDAVIAVYFTVRRVPVPRWGRALQISCKGEWAYILSRGSRTWVGSSFAVRITWTTILVLIIEGIQLFTLKYFSYMHCYMSLSNKSPLMWL